MAKNRIAYYTNDGRYTSSTASNSSATVTALTAGTDGTKIKAIILTNVTGTGTFQLFINDGISNNVLLTLTDPVIGTDLLALTKLPLDANGNKYMNIPSGYSIRASHSGGSANAIVSVYGEDY